MTAIVGILNKHAIAIAADSAVTITNSKSRKILNQTNKIYTLSKTHPVGIMLHNSGSFLSTPWEVIIKIYRKELKDKSFDTLSEYMTDFIEFLRTKDFFSDEETQQKFFKKFLNEIIEGITTEALLKKIDFIKTAEPDVKEVALKAIENKMDEIKNEFADEVELFEEFEDYDYKDYQLFVQDIFDDIIKRNFTDFNLNISDEFKEKLKELSYILLRSIEERSNYTGTSIVGYGESEIYPSIITANIYFAIGNRLRYWIDEDKSYEISNKSPSGIIPLAQTDVISTILTGIDPKLQNIFEKNVVGILTSFSSEILKIVDQNVDLKEQIEALDVEDIFEEFKKKIFESQRKTYILPLLNALSSLGKEDMAEMAESLIYLTYLKRRITFAEESVGGPVDVAVISKGDGFIWIKRKMYFKPELNQSFFDNYFK